MPAASYGNLSLVIPAYREEKGIGQAIIEAEEALSLLNLSDYEILIIDDGSLDSTFEAASQIASLYSHTKIESNIMSHKEQNSKQNRSAALIAVVLPTPAGPVRKRSI